MNEIAENVLAWLEAHESLSSWLASIGTLLAVIVSLWLARRESRTELRIRADAGLGLDPKKGAGWSGVSRTLMVTVTNHGLHPLTVDSFGFGLWPKRSSFTRPILEDLGDTLPARLEYGQEVHLIMPLDPWLEEIVSIFGLTRLKTSRLRVHVRTTLGHIERRRIGSLARRELRLQLKYGSGPRPTQLRGAIKLGDVIIGGK